jgi:hypothetical protein
MRSGGVAAWLAMAPQQPGCFGAAGLLPGLPVYIKTPFQEPTFPDGIACTGVLYKDSGIAPAHQYCSRIQPRAARGHQGQRAGGGARRG